MKTNLLCFLMGLMNILLLSGCDTIGSKSTSMAFIYIVTTLISLLVLILYCYMIPKKNMWFLLLFGSILVVNIGYLSLAISKSLEEALLANRISYLGSVFLPMAMMMIILKVIHFKYPKWLPGLLFIIGIAVFLIAASPGYLDIYYKDVFITNVHGITVLKKVYGPWHNLYPVYLLIYFTSMISVIIQSVLTKKRISLNHAVILAIAVFVNIGVWLIEQLVSLDFEFLSVSYIISELFLFGLHIAMTENERLKELVAAQEKSSTVSNSTEVQPENSAFLNTVNTTQNDEDRYKAFLSDLSTLTKTEHIIFDFYVEGKTTKEILQELNITENTLKFHNKNIYSKFNVPSRKKLMELYNDFNKSFPT